jgi:hypothetical protein
LQRLQPNGLHREEVQHILYENVLPKMRQEHRTQLPAARSDENRTDVEINRTLCKNNYLLYSQFFKPATIVHFPRRINVEKTVDREFKIKHVRFTPPFQ